MIKSRRNTQQGVYNPLLNAPRLNKNSWSYLFLPLEFATLSSDHRRSNNSTISLHKIIFYVTFDGNLSICETLNRFDQLANSNPFKLSSQLLFQDCKLH